MGHILVGPDNGIFTGILHQMEGIEARELSNQNYWRNREPSGTFQGRDVFAPVGAHLASGADFAKLAYNGRSGRKGDRHPRRDR